MRKSIDIPVTVDAIMALEPCEDWPRERVEENAESWPENCTLLWIVQHGTAPAADRVWLAMQLLTRHDRAASTRVLRSMLCRLDAQPCITAVIELQSRSINGDEPTQAEWETARVASAVEWAAERAAAAEWAAATESAAAMGAAGWAAAGGGWAAATERAAAESVAQLHDIERVLLGGEPNA